jgi:hypothetical protein
MLDLTDDGAFQAFAATHKHRVQFRLMCRPLFLFKRVSNGPEPLNEQVLRMSTLLLTIYSDRALESNYSNPRADVRTAYLARRGSARPLRAPWARYSAAPSAAWTRTGSAMCAGGCRTPSATKRQRVP